MSTLWILVPSWEVLGVWFRGSSTFSDSVWLHRYIYIYNYIYIYIYAYNFNTWLLPWFYSITYTVAYQNVQDGDHFGTKPWPFRTDCIRGLYWMNGSYESCRHSQVQVVSIAPCRRHIILPWRTLRLKSCWSWRRYLQWCVHLNHKDS